MGTSPGRSHQPPLARGAGRPPAADPAAADRFALLAQTGLLDRLARVAATDPDTAPPDGE